MLLGLILIIFVGKKFYELAHEYDKSRWGFAIAGVVSYYGCMIISAFIIGIIIELSSPGYINESNERWIGLLGVPFAILGCWGFYKILEKNWSKTRGNGQPDTLDGGMINNSNQPTRY
jgi:hypothetical protein